MNPYIKVYENTLETVREQFRLAAGMNQDARAEWIREVEKLVRDFREAGSPLGFGEETF